MQLHLEDRKFVCERTEQRGKKYLLNKNKNKEIMYV